MPPPKTYRLLDGTQVLLPSGKNDDQRELAVKPLGRFFGAPLVPTGDPLIDGVGPAAWATHEISGRAFSHRRFQH